MTGSTKTEEDESLYTVATNDDLLAVLNHIAAMLGVVLRTKGFSPAQIEAMT
jgi:hypothetical protein